MNFSHMSTEELETYVEAKPLSKLERELYLRWQAEKEDAEELRKKVERMKQEAEA